MQEDHNYRAFTRFSKSTRIIIILFYLILAFYSHASEILIIAALLSYQECMKFLAVKWVSFVQIDLGCIILFLHSDKEKNANRSKLSHHMCVVDNN